MAAFIASQREAHGIPHAVSCRALGVSQSWSCKWKDGELPPRAVRRERLKAETAQLFAAGGLSRRWYGDGTEIVTGEGKLHLDSVMDMGSRRVLGHALGEHHDAALDNAVIESWHSTLELELRPLNTFATRAAARAAAAEWRP